MMQHTQLIYEQQSNYGRFHNIVIIMNNHTCAYIKEENKKDSLAAAAAGSWPKVIVDGCG
jgi:hypothetical protein